MSDKGSKFGMLKNLQQSAVETEAEKQKNTTAEQQESRKPEQHKEVDVPGASPLRHYSTYMPADLYARLQVYVAKQKSVRGHRKERVSIQNVISEAVRQYLEEHDK
ncbi:hypothetical protein ACFFLM_12765 [Deinococcus oregonensis]|uniref:CopG family transcriptional regulator n=1 Tax=Deinococcus oregonensis TaxID=1805970 RepID=A0ABV6AZA4_9DEIO